jgi:hypothetical protein
VDDEGAILTVQVLNPGNYLLNPSLTANGVTGGSGTDALFDLTMSAMTFSDSLAANQSDGPIEISAAPGRSMLLSQIILQGTEDDGVFYIYISA